MHGSHFPRGSFRPLIIAGEILFHVTVCTGYPQGAAVTEVHDQKKLGCRSLLKDVNILENLTGGLLFSPGYLFRDSLYETIVDFLVGLFAGLSLHRRRWRLRRARLCRNRYAYRANQRQDGDQRFKPISMHESSYGAGIADKLHGRPVDYSFRSATIGSVRVARRAGK